MVFSISFRSSRLTVTLRLEGLPFPPNHFDFVRIVGIGLGVPEDEVSR